MTVMYVRALNLLTSCISQGGGDVVHTERLCDLCPRLPSAPLRHASPYVNAVSASIDLRLDEQTCGSQPLDKRSQGALLALSDLSATQGATLLPSVLAYLSSIALYNPAPDSHTVYRLCLSVAQQTAHPTSAQAIVVALQSALAAPADHHAILHGVLEALSEQVVSGAGPALRPLLFAALAACIQQVELAAKLKASVTSRSERGPARRSYERWTATQTLAISSISLQLVRDDILDAKVVGRLYQMGLHVLGFTRSGNGEGAAEQIDGLPSDLSALRTQSGHLTVPMMVACVGLTVSCAIPVPDRAADLLQCLFKLMRSAVRPGSDSSMRKCKPVWRAMLQGITRLVVNDVALIAQAVEQLKALLETPDIIAHPDHEELHEDVSSALATILRAELQMPNRNFTDMIARKLVFSLDNTLLMSTSDQDDTASGTEQSLLLLLGRVTSMVNHPKVTEHVLPMLINKFSNSPKLLHIVIPHLTSIALVSEPRIFNDVVSLLTNIYSKPFIPDNKWNRKEIPDALLQLATRVTSAELRSGLLKSLLKLFKTLGRQIQERMEQSAIYNFSSMAGALGFLLPSLSALMDPRPSSRLADRAHSRSPWESDIASRPTTVTLFDAVDADVKWFRSLWNYLVLYKFADCGQPNLWPPAWAVAVKTIASRTPSLALSSCSPSSASTGSHDLDRFSESGLSQVGLADLRARLAALLPAHATASTTLSVGAVSYVMTIEALESLRASTGTFTNMFDYLHDQTSATVSKMVDAVADNVFQLFLEALSSWPAGSPRRLNLESHAVFLFGACCSRYRRVSVKASEYLKELVTRFPFLQWSRPCLFALFDAVAAVQSTTAGLDLIAADGRSSTGWTTLRVPPLDLPDDAKSRLLISQTMQKTLQRWLDNAAFVVPSHLSSLLQIYVQELQYAAPDDVSPSFGITSSLRSILAGKRNVVRALVCPADADPASANLLQSLATRQRYLGQVRGQFHAHCRSRNKTVPGTPFGEVMARGLLDEFHDVLAKYRRTGAVTRAVLAQFERGMFLSAALLVWSVQAPVPEDEDAAAFSDTPLAVHREVDPRELMHLVCMAPVYMFTEAAMQVATATWSWLFAVSHAFSVGLLVTMVPAWSHTVDSQLGLFSGTKDASAQFDGCLFTRIGSYFRPDERVAACHDLWIQFLIDRFDTLSDRSLGSLRAVESMLHKALSRPDRLSCAPFAFGPRFRLLYLGLRMVGSVRHTDLTLLHDRVMACAFAWFYDGPRWSPHTNWADVVRDAATIATFIESVRACAGSAATTRSAAPATTPSAASTGRVATAYAASSSSIRDTSSVHGGSVRQTVRSEAPHKAASLVTDPGPGYGNVPTPNRQASEYSDAPWGLRTSAVNDQVTVGVRRHSSNADLLILLLSHEFHRLVAWHNPRRSPDLALRDENLYAYNIGAVGSEEARRYFHLAWHIDPRLAYRLAQRLSWVPQLRTLIRARIQTHPLAFANVAESVRLLANAKNCKGNAPQLKHLALFESCSLPTALRLLCQPYADCETVTQYTMRSLGRHAFTGVIFYMSEIIQALRHDRFGSLARFLLRAGTLSPHLAHQLIWALQTEAVVDESPRSRQAPNDPLPAICAQLEQQVVASLPDAAADFYRAEFAFIASITRLSSDLLEIPKPMKEERRAELQRQLQRVRAEALESARHPLYLPTDHTAQVVDILVPTAKPLQSAARVPFLVEFLVRSATTTTTTTPAAAVSTKQVIFKAGDDCRQDCLALQFIRLAKDVFASVGLPLFVYPYLVIPNRTGPTRDLGGVIECVRRSASRDELGKSNGLSLRDYFLSKYGRAEGAAFKQAQRNFVLSMAGYAVCCYLLQVKDRHNGNILLDDDGHVVHIDFGFIFDISPAKDMKFEPGGFKLTLEMVEVMDNYDSDLWNWFVELCARGYLAVRAHRDDFLSIADLMSASALGCFKADSVANLKQRFAPDKNERDAAQHMINVVLDSYNNFRTNTYDSIQYLQQGIYYYNQS